MRKVPLLYIFGTLYGIVILWTLHYVSKTKNLEETEEEFSLELEENLKLIDDKDQVESLYCINKKTKR